MAGEDETPDDSIASALASAIAQHETPKEEPAAAPAEKETHDAPVRDAVADGEVAGTVRGDAPATTTEGTEAPKEGEGESAEAKTGEEKPATASSTEPPANWKAADKETFKKLPPDAQKFLLGRHREMEAAFTKKTQEIASFKRDYDPVAKLLEPYGEQMKAQGWTPFKLISAWANAEKGLMASGGSAEDIVAGVIKHYRVDMGNVARKLGLRPRARQETGNGAAQPDAVEHQPDSLSLSPDHPLMKQLQSIQARIDADDRARMDAVRRQQTANETRVMIEIEEFKSAVDGEGNLKHPHFDELETDMVRLAQSANATGRPMPLTELYDAAVWANPSTRKEMLAAQERAQQAKNAEEARAKAAAARKAGSSVTGAPGSGQAPAGRNRAGLSLREELEASFSDHAGGRI